LYWLKTFIQLILILVTIGCKAQGITIVLEDIDNYEFNEYSSAPRIAHVKDINNILGEYLGTWIGTHDGKSYEFRIIKHTLTVWNDYDYLEDILIMRYIIKDSNGAILEDTTNIPVGDPLDDLVIQGMFMRYDDNANPESYQLHYYGRDHKCGQDGDIVIKRVGAKLNLYYAPSGEFITDCDKDTVENLLPPLGGFTLTKQ